MTEARFVLTRRLGWVLFVLTALVPAPGCDSESFVPPPPKELSRPAESGLGGIAATAVETGTSAGRASSGPAAGRKAARKRPAETGSGRIIELLLAHPADSDRNYLIKVLRREVGKAKMVFRLVEPESGTSFPATALAKQIRAAVDRGASGLIVEPIGDAAVDDGLHEAVDQGMAVLSLDNPIASRGGQSIPYIRHGPLADSGREIVQLVLEADKLFHRKEPGRIVILHRRSSDTYADERLRSLADPLKAAGRAFSVIEFEGDAIQAGDLLKKSFAANPKVDMVFADEDAGMSAAQLLLSDWTGSGHPPFLFAGYLAYDIRTATEVTRQAAAYGDRSVESFGVKAFQAIQCLLDQRPVDNRINSPIAVHKRPVLFVPNSVNPDQASGPTK